MEYSLLPEHRVPAHSRDRLLYGLVCVLVVWNFGLTTVLGEGGKEYKFSLSSISSRHSDGDQAAS